MAGLNNKPGHDDYCRANQLQGQTAKPVKPPFISDFQKQA
jgi:hypothetical protein